LANITGTLEIYSNAKLTVLDATNGFEGLVGISSKIDIYNNPLLTSVGGFTALASTNAGINISDNGVTSISGFPNLTDVIGDLTINNNQALQTVSGFPKLAQLGGKLSVRDSDKLTQFDGLKSLLR